MSKYLPLLISAVVGAGTWIGIGMWSGRKEAWDSPLYWSAGFPLMLIAVLLISLKWPEKPGRCGVTAMVAQAFLSFIQAFPQVNLWPLSLFLFFILSLPLVLAASLGSIVRKRFINHDESKAKEYVPQAHMLQMCKNLNVAEQADDDKNI